MVINFDYNTPKLSPYWNNLFSRSVLDGWQLSGVASFLSGEPMGFTYTLTNTTDITGGGGLGVDSSTTYGLSGVRPDLNGSAILPKDQRTPTMAFNTAAVVMPPASKYGRGNSGKDPFRGPGINNWDLSMMKNFKFGPEGGRLDPVPLRNVQHVQSHPIRRSERNRNQRRHCRPFRCRWPSDQHALRPIPVGRDGRRIQLGLKFAF